MICHKQGFQHVCSSISFVNAVLFSNNFVVVESVFGNNWSETTIPDLQTKLKVACFNAEIPLHTYIPISL